MVESRKPKPPYLINSLRAFFIGGLVCLFGQAIQNMYVHFFDFNEKTVGNPTVATMIFLSSLLTGLGVYDRMGQYAGAGLAVPVTGFANSITSAALEYRSEGLIAGIGGNMFKLAGSVIIYGVVSAFFVGLIKAIFSS